MSRLDSHIRRLQAQRASIHRAATLIADLPGPILELGLGNGRTFDHLREHFPHREIFVFDFALECHPASRPEPRNFIQGDFRATLPTALARIGSAAALAHCDFGSHDVEKSRALAATVAPLLDRLLAPGAVVLSDLPMTAPDWRALPLPRGVKRERYFINQVGLRQATEPNRLDRGPPTKLTRALGSSA